jgi:hypothetical protein
VTVSYVVRATQQGTTATFSRQAGT